MSVLGLIIFSLFGILQPFRLSHGHLSSHNYETLLVARIRELRNDGINDTFVSPEARFLHDASVQVHSVVEGPESLAVVLRVVGEIIYRGFRNSCESLLALGNVKTVIATRPLFQCRSCRYQSFAMAGTTMHCSKVSIKGWFASAYHVVTNMRRFNEPARTLTEVAL